MSAAARLRTCLLWSSLLALDVLIQVTMKLAGDRLAAVPLGVEWVLAALSSGLVWISLAGYLVTFVLWLAILHASQLSVAFPVTALAYALVPLCGWLLLEEEFSTAKAAGIALIIAGVALQWSPPKPP